MAWPRTFRANANRLAALWCALAWAAAGCGHSAAPRETSDAELVAVASHEVSAPARVAESALAAPLPAGVATPRLLRLPDPDVTEAALISTTGDHAEAMPALVRLPMPNDELDSTAPETPPEISSSDSESAEGSGGPWLLAPQESPPADGIAGHEADERDADDDGFERPNAAQAEMGEKPTAAPQPAASESAPSPLADTVDAAPQSTAVRPSAPAAVEPPSCVDALLADASPIATGEPTGAIVSQRAQAKIRRSYALAQRGAYFAARGELVDVLQELAEAKDQKFGAARRTAALASGLRALDEAADFSPKGGDQGAALDARVIVSSHRTPVAKSSDAAGLMPPQLADMYLRYAQLQLGAAVAGEPAGSMALHALGKIYSQLAQLEPEKAPLARRQAFALQHAALLARADNHLAAHEVGVLLAESGHFAEAEYLLTQVATREPHPVVFRNLASVQRSLGRNDLAAASERQAQAYAARGASRVAWVPPGELARTTDAVPSPPMRIASAPPHPRAASVPNAGRPPHQYMR